jgi:hypothetical protein
VTVNRIWLVWMTWLGMLLGASAVLSACAPSCGVIGSTRCEGELAQVCDADRHWSTFFDCREVGAGFVCAPTDVGHTCIVAADGGIEGDR